MEEKREERKGGGRKSKKREGEKEGMRGGDGMRKGKVSRGN